MTQNRNVDVAIIGAGSAGLSARRAAIKEGASVLMADPGPFGTTCARVGCMPSKLLIAAAEAARRARQAPIFGVDVPTIEIDAKRVFERVRSERDRFAGFVVSDIDDYPDDHLIRERVRFVGPNQLETESGDRIQAKSIVIAAGSSPFTPGVFRDLKKHAFDNEGVFELDEVPPTLAVIGAGVIGLELGQALANLGSKVTVFNIDDRIGPTTDPIVSRYIRQTFAEGLDLQLSARVEEVREDDDGVLLAWDRADGSRATARFHKVLLAAGRTPNVHNMGLEFAGLELNARGLPSIDPLCGQAGNGHIFFAGDVTGDRPLLHEASDEGLIAGQNAARLAIDGRSGINRFRRRTPLAVVFTHPQIGMVGHTATELSDKPHEVGEVRFDNQGRARVMGENKGIVRVYGHPKTGRLLGAEMFGPDVEHTAHLLAWAIQSGLTVTEALKMPFYHPVVEEGIRTALRDLAFRMGLETRPLPHCLDCGPGA